jgi:hypothetical protein
MPRPVQSWPGLFDVVREAKARATLQGITDIAIRRIDARWHRNQDTVDRWRPPHFLHRGHTKSALIPRGHIAVLVEGWAEKE